MKAINFCIIWLILLSMISGCAQMQVDQRKNELTTFMDLLLGKTTEKVILALGTPTTIQIIPPFIVYKYHQSYGSRTQAKV